MQIDFSGTTFSDLDDLQSEILVCAIWSDARPSRGVAERCDFRLCGRIGKLQANGQLLGNRHEKSLFPGRPRLSVDKILVIGLGEKSKFTDVRLHESIELVLDSLEKMRVRTAAIELPGRADLSVDVDKVGQMFLSATMQREWTNNIILLETSEGIERIKKQMMEQRRVRRLESESG